MRRVAAILVATAVLAPTPASAAPPYVQKIRQIRTVPVLHGLNLIYRKHVYPTNARVDSDADAKCRFNRSAHS